MSDPFARFGADWLGKLCKNAQIVFEHCPRSTTEGTHCDIADAFVSELGLKPIGFNWELLDASAGQREPRSAFSELVKALSRDIANPNKPALPANQAEQCAQQFIDLFARGPLTIVSNRYDGLWNPISGAATEWGFIGFDQEHAALLLLIAP